MNLPAPPEPKPGEYAASGQAETRTENGGHGCGASRQVLAASRLLTGAAILGTVVGLFHLLYSAACAFTWQNFLMSDYGVYTNTLWNLAHGNGFRFLVDHNYLKTHLSFSLALLAPLFRVWDHPALLLVVQWLFLAAGCALLYRLLHRARTPPHLTWAILFFYVASPFTQSVLLSEFHGVSAHLLLVPWLGYCLSFNRRWTGLPLALLLGLREDAGFLLVPFLLYVAWRGRWKVGYLYALAALVYPVIAVALLYPMINGVSLLHIRDSEVRWVFDAVSNAARLEASAWFFLPFLPFFLLAGKGWKPLSVLPLVAYALNMASGFPRQFRMGFHYPAAAMALTVVAMAWACREAGFGGLVSERPTWRRGWILALCLLLITTLTHAQRGFFLGGGNSNRVYARRHPLGLAALEAARRLPREGLLLCTSKSAPFAANRKDIMTWLYWKPESQEIDVALCTYAELSHPRKQVLADALREGSMGVFCEVFPFLVLKRGYSYERNALVLRRVEHGIFPVATMRGDGASFRHLPAVGVVRHWAGDGSRAPITLAYGQQVTLPAGRYAARFAYLAAAPRRAVRDSWGWFSVHAPGREEPLAWEPIPRQSTEAGAVRQHEVRLHLKQDCIVEARVTGADAELWLQSVTFEPLREGQE